MTTKQLNPGRNSGLLRPMPVRFTTARLRAIRTAGRFGSSAFVLVLLLLLGACDSPPKSSPEAQALWRNFLATNSAWLAPEPGPLSYELALHSKAMDPPYTNWQESGRLRTWCAPGKNLRIIHESRLSPAAGFRTNEVRYFQGKGGQVALKPGGRVRELGLDLWLAGRVGAGFLSSLHLCCAWGLPPGSSSRPGEGDCVLLVLTNLGLARAWRKDVMVDAAYGLHPAVFASEAQGALEAAEITIGRSDMLPRRIVERGRDGRVWAQVDFETPWLETRGRKVPSRIRCSLTDPKCNLTYEFTFEQGAWLLKEFTRDFRAAPSLCAKAVLKSLSTDPLPDSRFPDPRDLELPAQSVTTLAPGERVLQFTTSDGLNLEAKLSLPTNAVAPVPVVFFLPGAGPWTFDRPLVYPDLEKLNDMMPPMKACNYCDFFARELCARGIGFFRINKRGCAIVRNEEGHPQEIVNRSIFSRATPSVLLDDYACALKTLCRQSDVDATRIVLLGASEGTRLATRLAAAQCEGQPGRDPRISVRALALFGYSGDSTRDTIVWQQTVGPWRNVARLFDNDSDGKVTRAEYDEVIKRAGDALARFLPFEQLDRNRDGTIVPGDMAHRAHLKEILKAVEKRDDDYLWENLVQLSSAHLLEDWQSPPLHRTLLQLPMPVGIFHGENDGSCRVEAVREAARAFQQAGKTNLLVRIYPKCDHDLNWPRYLRDGKILEPFVDIFNYIGESSKVEVRSSL